MDRPEFTAVITCYFEENSIDEFYHRLSTTLNNTGRSYEIIFVNDGSTDKTFSHLEKFYQRDDNVTCIMDMFRNFGQTNAMAAGITQANGQHFIFLDSDLQLDPEQLPILLAKFDQGFDSVSGFRQRRQDPWHRLLASKLASFALRRAAKSQLKDLGCTFRIMHGNLIRGFGFGPSKAFNQTEIVSKISRTSEVLVNHHARKYGRSGWTFEKLFDFYMESFINISSRPFQFLAVIVFMLAGIGALRILLAYIVDFTVLNAVTNGLILSIVLTIGLFNIAILALIGEFVIRAFRLAQDSPKYIVREIKRKTPLLQ